MDACLRAILVGEAARHASDVDLLRADRAARRHRCQPRIDAFGLKKGHGQLLGLRKGSEQATYVEGVTASLKDPQALAALQAAGDRGRLVVDEADGAASAEGRERNDALA